MSMNLCESKIESSERPKKGKFFTLAAIGILAIGGCFISRDKKEENMFDQDATKELSDNLPLEETPAVKPMFEITYQDNISPEQIVEKMEYKLDPELFDNPEELVKQYRALTENLIKQGATAEDKEEAISHPNGYEGYAKDIAISYDEEYFKGIMGEGYENNPNLSKPIKSLVSAHRSHLNQFYITANSTDSRDEEAYDQKYIVYDITSIKNSSDSIRIDYTMEIEDNRDKNRIVDLDSTKHSKITTKKVSTIFKKIGKDIFVVAEDF